MNFKARVQKFEEGLWSIHIKVPQKAYEKLSADGNKRVLCTINDNEYFHAGFMPDGQGGYFIMLSKPKMKTLGLLLGQDVEVKLEKDTSRYGMHMPEEMEEVLMTDDLGLQYFEALSDGKKRSLIYMVDKVKNPDLKISKALTILDHLKVNEGNLDYKLLNQAFKESRHR